ncbi:hypothetical protein chiPu_0021401 [Chiloscyllium punctatum]|uniref:Uncharacterized protein n=1 Tax=Chiloscyllium punctatum TaxID=137246 RepID=A0A401REK6_CHIPU|nr:hypothetical protein [Chiloscyllium punctatum]
MLIRWYVPVFQRPSAESGRKSMASEDKTSKREIVRSGRGEARHRLDVHSAGANWYTKGKGASSTGERIASGEEQLR